MVKNYLYRQASAGCDFGLFLGVVYRWNADFRPSVHGTGAHHTHQQPGSRACDLGGKTGAFCDAADRPGG